jgi:hypothetical protein
VIRDATGSIVVGAEVKVTHVTLEALRSEQHPSWRKIHTEALDIIDRRIAVPKKRNR